MRIAITGATGNVGAALVAALAADSAVDELVGVARRPPGEGFPLTRFVQADIADDDLADAFAGPMPSCTWPGRSSPRRHKRLWRTNVLGTKRVLDAAAEAGMTRFVAASSVAAYGPGPKDRLVDEDWPRTPIPASTYSVHKVTMERQLDIHQESHPDVRMIRLRPALIFQRASASEQRRPFAGPFVPNALLRADRLPLLPDISGLLGRARVAAARELRERNREHERAAVEELLHERLHPEQLQARDARDQEVHGRDRSDRVEAAGHDRRRAKERGCERRQQEAEGRRGIRRP
jgi:UDP-glucose 4-epimerase